MEDPFSEDDETKIVFQEAAKTIVVMFRALQEQGLSGQEAAALTAALFAQNLPSLGEGPRDGS